MPLYKYNALSDRGELLQGTYTAGDRNQLISFLRDRQQRPVKVEEVFEGKDVKKLSILGNVTIKDIAVFCRQFYTLINAGVTLIKALDIIRLQTEKRKFRETISNVYESVQKGSTFSEALRGHKDTFPEILINMVEAGEISGKLDTVMNRMAVHFEKENKLRSKVRGAMVYPAVIAIAATSVVIFLLTVIMPTFIGMFTSSGVQLPLPTRILLGLSEAINSYWYLFLLGIVAVIYITRRYLTSDTGRLSWDRMKLRLPIIKGLVTRIITTRFTRTLSILLYSGIPLLQAMDVVAKVVGNRVVSDGIMNAREDMRRGTDLASPVRKMKVFPPMVDSMIRIGEESGTLDEILSRTADFYDDEVETSLQKTVSLLDPLLIIIMAGIVGFIVISIAMPMFEMMQTVQ